MSKNKKSQFKNTKKIRKFTTPISRAHKMKERFLPVFATFCKPSSKFPWWWLLHRCGVLKWRLPNPQIARRLGFAVGQQEWALIKPKAHPAPVLDVIRVCVCVCESALSSPGNALGLSRKLFLRGQECRRDTCRFLTKNLLCEFRGAKVRYVRGGVYGRPPSTHCHHPLMGLAVDTWTVQPRCVIGYVRSDLSQLFFCSDAI